MEIDWDAPGAVSRLRGSLQTGPGFGFGDWARAEDKPYYAEAMKALRELKPELVRYQGWRNRLDLTVAALEPPRDGATSWDFSRIDPPFVDFLAAMEGRPFVLNFSTLPAWLGSWDAEPDAAAAYFARFAAWYTRGGFDDEAGVTKRSGHALTLPYWEVLNEPDFEDGGTTVERYVGLYDAIVRAVRAVSPDTKFVGLALTSALADPGFTTRFLNPANHAPGVPLDYISHHFYAQYRGDQTPAEQTQAVFGQAEQFADAMKFVAAARDELSPATGLMVTEIGAMNQGARGPRPDRLAFEVQLSAAMYACLYARLATLGVKAAHVSGLVAVQPDQIWQELAMIDWDTGRPNARYWVLKLLIDHFGPESRLAPTRNVAAPPFPLPAGVVEMFSRRAPVFGQGFVAPTGARKVLLVNRSVEEADARLDGLAGARVEMVDLARSTGPARHFEANGDALRLPPLAVCIADLSSGERP